MKNRVKEFLSEVFGEVRAFERDGQIWFHANDVMNILEYAEGSKRTKISRLNKKGVTKCNVLTNGGNQEANFINEPNLYLLVFGSKMDKAEEFQDWICGTVIPALRKDGAYVQDEEKVSSGEMSEEEFVLKAMTILQSKVERLTKERDRYSRFIGDKMNKVTKKELAQRLNCTPQRLAKILKEQKIYTPKTNQIAQWFLDINKDINVVKEDPVDVTINGKEIHKIEWQYTGEGAVRVVKFLEEQELVKYSENNGFVLQ